MEAENHSGKKDIQIKLQLYVEGEGEIRLAICVEEKKVRGKRIKNRSFGGIICYKSDGPMEYIIVKGRHSGIWSLPKGHGYDTETELESAKREIYEETGIQLEINPIRRCRMKGDVYYTFVLKERLERISALDTFEVEETRWVTMEEMTKMKVNSGLRELLRKNGYKRIFSEIQTKE